jgi:hypothetical protein
MFRSAARFSAALYSNSPRETSSGLSVCVQAGLLQHVERLGRSTVLITH